MVIDSKTLKPLHQLTISGQINYNDYLEKEADEILYKKDHPIMYFIEKIIEFFNEEE